MHIPKPGWEQRAGAGCGAAARHPAGERLGAGNAAWNLLTQPLFQGCSGAGREGDSPLILAGTTGQLELQGEEGKCC